MASIDVKKPIGRVLNEMNTWEELRMFMEDMFNILDTETLTEFGANNRTVRIDNAGDADLITGTGFYYTVGTANTPYDGFMEVFHTVVASGSASFQVMQRITNPADGTVQTRFYTDGGWSAWA
jgi:hypothetical protein